MMDKRWAYLAWVLAGMLVITVFVEGMDWFNVENGTFLCQDYEGNLGVECGDDSTLFFDEVYGEMFVHTDAGKNVDLGSNLSEYYNISEFSVGYRRLVDYLNSTLVVNVSGYYKLNWALSFSGGGSQLYEVGVFVNDLEREACEAHRLLGAGGDVGSASGTCIIPLQVGDLVRLSMRESTAPLVNDAIVFTGNVNIVRVGGI